MGGSGYSDCVLHYYTVCKWYAVCVCGGGGGENTMFYTMETCRELRQVQVGDGGECMDD